MKVMNKRAVPVTIAPPGKQPIVVEPGATAEVDDELGQSLLEQPDRWTSYGVDTESSVSAVLAQVGNDKTKAQKALDDEQAGDKPRKTLVDALTKIIEAEEG